jgi:DNA-binding transcriptional MerR regulator/methylmalonyl-CoA mutase cobalamin-binding subunit
MGAVSRHTGIGEHTLRAWERRFGFPRPRRLPSGHRRFTAEQVRRLALINTALSRGYRAGDVVALPESRLEELLRQSASLAPAPTPPTGESWLPALLEAASQLDRQTISSLLHRDAVTLGVSAFLRSRVAPLLEMVGNEWVAGRLGIRNEHLLTEVVDDVLRGLREPLEPGTRGAPVVLASLPGELHSLGLQLAALTVVATGRRVALLGPNLPPEEIASAAEALAAVGVGLSVSEAAEPVETARRVGELRAQLPGEMRLWLGGTGAASLDKLPEGVSVLAGLDDLERELAELP